MTEKLARRSRTRAWLAGIVVIVILAGGAVVLTSGPRGGDDRSTATTDPATGDFTVEAAGGTLAFGQDGDDATLEFEGDEEGSFTFDLDGNGAVTEGEGGSFELTGSVPPGWPADFPVPAGAIVRRGSVVDAGALTQQSVTYQTDEAAATVLRFYEEALVDAAPVVDLEEQDPATFSATVSFEGPWTGFLTVTRTPEGTIIGAQLLVESAGAP